MRIERVRVPEHPMMERARQLYAQSFPVYEQRQYASQARIMGHEQYHYGMIMEEDAFLGLILYWETADFIYVEHFCMMEQVRGQGLGSRALALLGRGGKTVILEIDPPVDAVSMRRKGFYERAGFCANPYPHVHPPYDRAHTGHALTVMSYPQGLTPVQYERFARYLSQTVMDHVF